MTKTRGGIRPLFTAVLISFATMTGGAVMPAKAADWTAEEDIRNRIDFAGRQRMLTQQMSLYACFVMAGVERERYVGKTESVVRQFESYLDALQHGSESLRLMPETDEEVLDQFAAVSNEWNTLGPAIRQVMSGDLHAVPLRQVINLNLEVLDLSHNAVQAIQAAYLSKTEDPNLAKTIDVAGRQRMLSQKAAKDMCFLNLGLGGAAKESRLASTMEEFRTAMKALLEGSDADNIVVPPSRQIKRQLDRVARAWKSFEALALVLEKEGAIPERDMIKLANLSQQVLLEMSLAVTMYTQS